VRALAAGEAVAVAACGGVLLQSGALMSRYARRAPSNPPPVPTRSMRPLC